MKGILLLSFELNFIYWIWYLGSSVTMFNFHICMIWTVLLTMTLLVYQFLSHPHLKLLPLFLNNNCNNVNLCGSIFTLGTSISMSLVRPCPITQLLVMVLCIRIAPKRKVLWRIYSPAVIECPHIDFGLRLWIQILLDLLIFLHKSFEFLMN